ncbi:MAG: hypothetical protein ACTHJ3_04345 [Pararhizobium sp.]
MSDILGALIHFSDTATAFGLPFAVMASCAFEAAGRDAARRHTAPAAPPEPRPDSRHVVPQCRADRPR